MIPETMRLGDADRECSLQPAPALVYDLACMMHQLHVAQRESSCMVSSNPACARARYLKHHPVKHMDRSMTERPNPAKYLLGVDIDSIERATIAAPTQLTGGPPPSRTTYRRDCGVVIGWYDGRDATWSHVECTSGSFHGYPHA